MTTATLDANTDLPADVTARLDSLDAATRERALRHLAVASRVCGGDPRVLVAIVDAVSS